MRMRVSVAALLVLAFASYAGAQSSQPEPLCGTWEWKGGGAAITLTLASDGTGSLDKSAITWTGGGGVTYTPEGFTGTLSITEGANVNKYAWKLLGDSLTLSGGDLDAPTTFVRKGGGKGGLGARKKGEAPAPKGDDWGATPAPGPQPAPPSPAPAATGGAAGTWELRTPNGVARMVLAADGSGSLNGAALKWQLDGGILSVSMNNATIMYYSKLDANSLTLSGGDLQQPATFQRAGAGGGEAPVPAPSGGGGGLVGIWTSPRETIEFRADGTMIFAGQSVRYAAHGDAITISGPAGSADIQYRLEGDTLTVTANGQRETYARRGGAGAQRQQQETAPAPGPNSPVAGVWVCQEASLDPQNYMSFTQYVTLFPDGSVGYAKAEGGASRSQVTENLERFRSWRSGVQGGGGDFGRWESDGRQIVVRWNRWGNLVSRGEVNLAAGTISLSGMGALAEGATLTFKREQ